jgi:hypothetical protein
MAYTLINLRHFYGLTFYNSADEGASPPSSWAHRPELLKVQPRTVH